MTKRDLVVRISKETGLIQEDVFAIIQKTLDYITEALVKGEHIEFRDFGVFEVCVRKSRVGRNPNRPQDVVQIPERRVVKFKPGKEMKKKVLGSAT
jgi:nucleoid DNA-binding protein